MKILVDENIPRMTVDHLRLQGHDVKDVRGTPEREVDDAALWQMTNSEERMLITTDKGFARFRHARHHGVLIVRLRQPNRSKIHERVLRGLDQFSPGDWPGLTVVMRDAVQSVIRSGRSLE